MRVNFIQNVVFLRPPQNPTGDVEQRTHEQPPLSNDELVRGIVHLYVPTARHIDGIRVQLRVTQSLAILDSSFSYVPTNWENSTLMERVLEIGVPMKLSKLNSGREPSASVTRAHSPAPNYGGGGRHNDSYRRESSLAESRHSEGGGVLGKMVRGVSRGRTPFRRDPSPAAADTPRTRSHSGLGNLGSDHGDHSSSWSATPQERTSGPTSDFILSPERSAQGTPISEADIDHISQALAEHGLRGRDPSRHSYEIRTRNLDEHSRGASLRRDYDGESRTGESSLPRNHSLEDERRGRSRMKAADVVVHDDNENGLELTKGVHAFEFAFIIPADSPPYDRSPFGKIKYLVKVTALGAGRAKSNVEEWKEFFPMVNPAPDGGMTPMTVLYNNVHATVGMLSIACTSNNISVGGLFNIDVHSPCPPVDLIVYMVRVSLHTTIELTTRRKGKQYVPVQKRKLFEKGHVVPPDQITSGSADTMPGYVRYAGTDHAWTVQGVARVPDDNAIRPSTIAGTKSALRFHHALVVEVVHSRDSPEVPDCATPDGKRKLKVFTLRQNVIIPSCCCAFDAVTLPTYTPKDTDTANVPVLNHGFSDWDQIVRANRDPGESHQMCVCGMSLADLSKAERAMLPPPDPTDLLLDRVRHTGKVGEFPSSSVPDTEASGSRSPDNNESRTNRLSWAAPPHLSSQNENQYGSMSRTSPRTLYSGPASSDASPLLLNQVPQELPPAYSLNQ
ncbi:hypothetical protein MYAM1_001208 [Malassezia yamatoensis]|uniref:Arrestin-like N-terminal domain-containing protein n=1 Tax=Malassezia yamatoensis TaxID=253288 RepID=A0AAJ5YSM0_9BASI|nr:hypothetical protein MYAM1_001208 [Malassezia yamatoensis]